MEKGLRLHCKAALNGTYGWLQSAFNRYLSLALVTRFPGDAGQRGSVENLLRCYWKPVYSTKTAA
jgi:hypothetical protein